MSKVLLLNADYSPATVNPLSTKTWQDSISLYWKGVVEPIAHYDKWVVHSPSIELQVPAVVRLLKYKKISRKLKFCPHNIFLRDNFTCQYCNKMFPRDKLTRDHVLPQKFNGPTNWENITTACHSCNNKKGHNISMVPKVQPHKPTSFELDAKATKRNVEIYHPAWKDYLSPFWDDHLIIKKY